MSFANPLRAIPMFQPASMLRQIQPPVQHPALPVTVRLPGHACHRAYSGDRDRLVRPMVITRSGDRDHLQHVAQRGAAGRMAAAGRCC